MNTTLHRTLVAWLLGEGRTLGVIDLHSAQARHPETVAHEVLGTLANVPAAAVLHRRSLLVGLRATVGPLLTRTILAAPATHIVDLSGCYLPGQSTPLAVVFSDSRLDPDRVRVVRCNRGEPRTPKTMERGHVWRSVVDARDELRSDEWATSQDFARRDAPGVVEFLTEWERSEVARG